MTQMKNWRKEESKRLGVAESTVAMNLKRGNYHGFITHRVNARLVFVLDAGILKMKRPQHSKTLLAK